MFMSNGPGGNHDSAIFCNYDAADDFLREQDTESYRFGRQEGWLERMLNPGDDPDMRGIGLRYHQTHVMTLWPNGDTEFDTGGWYTRSTEAWMEANKRFRVSLYEPRNGPRKPFRYSTIRFCGHDRNIERQLRDEWGMPPLMPAKGYVRTNYIDSHTFREYDGDTKTWRITEPTLHERAQHFQAELTRRKLARHKTYVFENGITFTQRGRCINGRLLSDAIDEERVEHAEDVARRRKIYGRCRAYRNRIEKALAGTLPIEPDEANRTFTGLVESGEIHPATLMTFVSRSLPGDVRSWLNFHESNGTIVMGNCPPLIRKVIARKVYELSTDALI